MAKKETLKAALQYQKRGFSVIPIQKNKKPFFKWEQYQREAADPHTIQEWWECYPVANVGIVTGKISGITVVDADSEQGREEIEKRLPDTLVMPIAKTPHGYHYYFSYEQGQHNTTRFITDCDIRSEGGYVVAPPSPGYSWRVPLDNGLPEVPKNLLSHNQSQKSQVVTSIFNGFIYKEAQKSGETPQANAIQKIPQGRRDEVLFHIANRLAKAYIDPKEVQYILALIAKYACNPPYPLSDIPKKIQSAESRKRNVAQEVRDWVEVTTGHFSVTESHRESQLVTKEEIHAANVEFRRLVDAGILENYKGRRGWYRKVENDLEVIQWEDANETPLNIKWPFGIERFVNIYEKNLAIFAGVKDAGKTAMALNFALMNRKNHKIRYLSSEMGAPELKNRLMLFDLPVETWRSIQFVNRASNFQDAISEDGVNIIDFLEVTDNFFEIAGPLLRIYEKLTTGIAVICLQKDPKKQLGRGDTFSMEKARLYVTLDSDYPGWKVKIISGKNRAQPTVNPRGLTRHYDIKHGAKIECWDDWKTA